METIPAHINDHRRSNARLGETAIKRWRYEGIGPEWLELEGRVSYDVKVLLAYIEKNTRVPSLRAAMEVTRGAVYRVAFSGLRNVLEQMSIGLQLE